MALLDELLTTTPVHRPRWLGRRDPLAPVFNPDVPAPAPVTVTPPFMPSSPGPLPIPVDPGSPHVGTPVAADASRLERLMAERATLGNASPSSKVSKTPWGIEVGPPESSPSRLKQALVGALQGAAMAGSSGDPWQALGGAATGAVAGGINPRLVQAMTRQQETDRLTGQIEQEQGIAARNAAIYAQQAQPELRALQIQRQIDEDAARQADRKARGEDRDADRALREKEANTRSEQAAAANKLRQQQLEETRRHNRETERKPGSKYRTVANTIFEVDDDGVWRVAPGAPPPFSPSEAARTEREGVRADERREKGRQAEALYRKGAEYWDQAKAKREEARQLGLGADGQPSRVAGTRNKESIDRLLREAESLEGKTRDVQKEGDLKAAEAESGPDTQPASSGTGKAFDLRRWKKDHPGQDPSGVIKRAKDAQMRIIE